VGFDLFEVGCTTYMGKVELLFDLYSLGNQGIPYFTIRNNPEGI
jgi:hypothetical protein